MFFFVLAPIETFRWERFCYLTETHVQPDECWWQRKKNLDTRCQYRKFLHKISPTTCKIHTASETERKRDEQRKMNVNRSVRHLHCHNPICMLNQFFNSARLNLHFANFQEAQLFMQPIIFHMQISFFSRLYLFHYGAPELFPVLWAEAFFNSQFSLGHMHIFFSFFKRCLRLILRLSVFFAFIRCISRSINLQKLTAVWMLHWNHRIIKIILSARKCRLNGE